jgi:hypothetical protein
VLHSVALLICSRCPLAPKVRRASGNRPALRRGALAAGVAGFLGLAAMAGLGTTDLSAQSARLRVDENIRFEPQGTIIARLQAGTSVQIEEDRGAWSRVTFEGSVWAASLQRRTSGTFDYVVSAAEGENLRSGPSGTIIGRLGEGTLLNEVTSASGGAPQWVRVRRTAWIWNASLDRSGGGAATQSGPNVPSRQAAPAATSATTTAPAPPAPTAQWLRVAPGGSALLASPDGDTLTVLPPGTEMQLLGREGSWARVRMEGWVWMPGAAPTTGARAPATAPPSDVVIRGVRPAELMREPDRFRGRLVEVTLQFISVERAEAIRVDFQEGEPFLLTRSPEADRTFVYLSLSPTLLAEARGLSPLDRIVVVGRVRASAASLTGNPILDLVELRRVR